MQIKVALRFRPFSHKPKTRCLLPRSLLFVEVYPTKFILYDYSSKEPKVLTAVDFLHLGPLEQFTVQQDLEKDVVFVSGFAKKGFFRYQLVAKKQHPFSEVTFMRVPENVVMRVAGGKEQVLHEKERCTFPETKKTIQPVIFQQRERLALGCHKAQEWEKVVARRSINEILPFWYQLAQSVPKGETKYRPTTPSLLGKLAESIEKKASLELEQALLDLFVSGFSDMLLPQQADTLYQGFLYPPIGSEVAIPIELLRQSFPLLRALFFQEKEKTFSLLPLLPPKIHCGRLFSLRTEEGHVLSFEWVKKQIRKVIFEPVSDGEYTFWLKKPIKHYRLSIGKQKKICTNGQIGTFYQNKCYLLDQFEQ